MNWKLLAMRQCELMFFPGIYLERNRKATRNLMKKVCILIEIPARGLVNESEKTFLLNPVF
jgi:hypothetical protein